MENLDFWILIVGALLCISILASLISSRVGMPLLLVFLAVGMLAGEDGLGGLKFSNFDTAYAIGNIALAVILLDGGMRTRMETFRVALKPALILATFGVVITSGLTGLLAMFIFDLTLMQGLLIGAIVGSTDAAAVFSMLSGKGVNLNQRVSATLEIESGTNDPMAIFLTLSLIALMTQENPSTVSAIINFFQQFGLGVPMGIAGGWFFAQVLRRLNLDTGFYPLIATGAGLVLFATTNLIGGSGFLAVYLAGLVMGNSKNAKMQYILPVQDGFAWLSQIALFLILGLLVTPSVMLETTWPALALAVGMIILVRPIAVLACLKPFFNYNWRELTFISWVGLRGAVPIVLAIFPMFFGVENAELYFNVAFFVVLISLLVQGTSLPWAAKWLGIEVPTGIMPQHRTLLGVDPEDDFESFVYTVKGETLHGTALKNLSFPSGARIGALFRNNQLIHPNGETQLQENDLLCVIGRETDLPVLSKMFSSDADYERQQRKFFGDFVLAGDAALKEVAEIYGLSLSPTQENLTLGELILNRLGGQTVVGDQMEWHAIRWVVMELGDEGVITQVGLKTL